MSQQKSYSRRSLVAVGTLILLFAGIVYAWSVISIPIASEFPDWTKAQLSVTFTIVMITFCLSSLVIGFLASKISPHTSLLIAAILFLTGFFISARANSLLMLYIGFGGLCGIGSGIAYNVVVSNVTKFFPGKQGLISGILLMGVALGSFIIGKLYQAFTPDAVGAWRTSFIIIGVITGIVTLIGSLFFRKMPLDTAAAVTSSEQSVSFANDLNTGEMLKTPSFWLFFIWDIVMTGAGLAVISQASGIVWETSAAVSAGAVATIVGLISIFNGIGRIFSGRLYDKSGRMLTMLACCILFAAAAGLLALTLKMQSVVLLVVSFVIVGLGYSCIPPTASAFVKDYYGPTHFSTNFPAVNTNILIASFASTVAGSLCDKTGSYNSIFLLLLTFSAIGIVSTVVISVFDKKSGSRSL